MNMRTCRICGDLLPFRCYGQRRYHSECYAIHYNALSCVAVKVKRTLRRKRYPGQTRYFTGKPCKNGHVAERRVSDGRCIECWRPRRADQRRKRSLRNITTQNRTTTICIICNAPLSALHHHLRKTCSKQCAHALKKLRYRERRIKTRVLAKAMKCLIEGQDISVQDIEGRSYAP